MRVKPASNKMGASSLSLLDRLERSRILLGPLSQSCSFFGWWGVAVFSLALLGSFAQAQTQPRTLSIVPLPTGTLTNGSLITVEVFITNDSSSDQLYHEAAVALFCEVPESQGEMGTLTRVQVTTDPDGDGVAGPSSGGIPILFENGMHPFSQASCRASATPELGGPPTTTLSPQETRYLMTVVYQLADYKPTNCAQANFEIVFKCGSSTPCDGSACPCLTDLRDEFNNPLPFNPQHAVVTVGDGTPCDDGQPCTLNDICSSSKCVGTYQASYYGDIVVQPGGDGYPDITDILCALDGFRNAADCPQADIAPCGGDGIIDVGDVLAVVDGFAGTFACPAPCP